MNHASPARRLLAGATAIAVGFLGAVAMAAAASASTYTVTVNGDAVCDTTSGEWVITWTVANQQADLAGTIRAATVTPNADVNPIAIGGGVPNSGDGALTATQRILPGAVSEATLSVIVTWGRVAPPSHANDTVDLSGECTIAPTPSPSPSPEPPVSPSPAPTASPSPSPSAPPAQGVESGMAKGQFDCEVLTLTLTNDGEEDLTVFVVPSVGETLEVTIPAGGTTEAIEFPASEGLAVDVQIDEGESALEDGPLEITSEAWAQLGCDDGGQGGEDDGDLPVTGTSTGLIATGAVALLALGGGLFLLARRRRITFTA